MKAERRLALSISDNVRGRMVEGSWIRWMSEDGTALKQRYGEDNVFDLSIGNPVMEPPRELKEELRKLVNNPVPGMHRYMENAGYADTRKAVAAQLTSEVGLHFTENDIVMTSGAAGGLNVVLKSILNPGDEIIVFAPYFLEYGNYIDNHGGTLRVIRTDSNFLPSMEALDDAINERTRGVIINSPNNPVGVVYDANTIKDIGRVIREKEIKLGTSIYLISDEAYRKLIFDGLKYPHVFPYHQRTVVVASHSKDLALAGERIGYIAVHPEIEQHADLTGAMIFCNRVLGFVNAPALMQRAVTNLQNVTVSIADYQRKRDLLYDNLVGMGYSLIKPQGAFYMFPRSLLEDDIQFVEVLRKYNVLIVPGRGFGTPGYFRLSFCVNDSVLEGALEGFKKAAGECGLN